MHAYDSAPGVHTRTHTIKRLISPTAHLFKFKLPYLYMHCDIK